MNEVPGIDEGRHVQFINGARQTSFVFDARVAAADALQSVGRVKAQQIGEGAPFEQPGIDLPFIPAQFEIRLLTVWVAQYGVKPASPQL